MYLFIIMPLLYFWRLFVTVCTYFYIIILLSECECVVKVFIQTLSFHIFVFYNLATLLTLCVSVMKFISLYKGKIYICTAKHIDRCCKPSIPKKKLLYKLNVHIQSYLIQIYTHNPSYAYSATSAQLFLTIWESLFLHSIFINEQFFSCRLSAKQWMFWLYFYV